MIAVVGTARCGTSLMMQTLNILGIGIPAPKFDDRHKNIKHLNPKGFYEFDSVLDNNFFVKHSFKGKAVKLFGYGLYDTYKNFPKLIDKIIVCRRNPEDAIKSSIRFFNQAGLKGVNPEHVYYANYATIDKIKKNYPHIEVNYEDFIQDTEQVLTKVVDFLEIEIDNDTFVKAVNNVEK